MKGIILAGGLGTRLYPVTKSISKHILPIYDKPMIYYPLSVLILAGISEILIISTSRDSDTFKKLLGDGSVLGLNIGYAVQSEPRGLADAFIVGEEFICKDRVALILGDNIFWGRGLAQRLNNAVLREEGATIFGYHVSNPSSFGVIELDSNNNAISIEEKPINPKSNFAVPGLYFYDNNVVEIAKNIKPSARGEIEITSINHEYLKRAKLKVELLGKEIVWFDTGTHRGLLEAANFVESIQSKQGQYIACLEEVAHKKGFISREQLLELGRSQNKTEYGNYIEQIALSV
jgi:glucose-1-phosphate thymidylyltransferase